MSPGEVRGRLAAELRPLARPMTLSIAARVVYLVIDVGLVAFATWAVAASALGRGLQLSLTVGILVLGAVVRAVARYVEQYFGHHVAFGLLATMRSEFFSAVAPLAPSALADTRSGDLTDRVTTDIDRVEVFYAHTVAPVVAGMVVPLLSVVAVGVWAGPLVASLLAVAMLLVGVVVPAVGSADSQAAAGRAAELSGDIAARIADDIQGVGDVSTYGAGDTRAEALGAAALSLGNEEAVAARIDGGRQALTDLIAGTALVVLAVAGVAVVGDLPTVAGVLAVAVVGFLPLREVQQVKPLYQRAMQAAERIFEVADRPAPVSQPADPLPPPPPPLSLRFDHVTFGYGTDSEALTDVSLRVGAGEMVAVVGPSGAGKSTLAHLAVRFDDPDTGRVLVGEVDVSRLSLDALRERVAVVTQTSHLFSGTVAENLRIGRPDASDADLERVAELAALTATIARLDRGYDTQVGELGSRLSGGQRQRLAVARALLTEAPIMILDEATSELDPLTQTELLGRIRPELAERAVLVITHRLATVTDAEEILVLDGGRLVERGTHSELVRAGGLYRRLWDRQRDDL